jgi:hypothetical protein
MRAACLAAVAVTVAVPAIGLAHEEGGRDGPEACEVRARDGDRVAHRGDLVVEEGERAGDVLALEGDVIVGAGAEVDDAISIGGDVVVEKGGVVRGTAVSVDGEIRVAGGARVDGHALSLGGRVRVSRGGRIGGETGTVSATFGGSSLAAALAREIAGRVTCEELEREVGEGEGL